MVNSVIWDFRELEALHSVQMNKLFEGGLLGLPIDKYVRENEVQKYLKDKYGER